MDDLRDVVKPFLEALLTLPPLERAKAATNAALPQAQDVVTEISDIREAALHEVVDGGMSKKDLATELGMTPTRVYALLSPSSNTKAERALLGTAALHVAIGAKLETRPSGTGGPNVQPSAVLSEEALAAYDLIAEAAAAYDLKASKEIVPPPGITNLNRANLVVMTSPRLLRVVELVLEADLNLGFSSDTQGWFLIDKNSNTQYRSPMDDGQPADYGYLGRLPRPDGKGTFLYVAGIHGRGTRGAAHHLVHHIPDLYKQVKNNRWSALVKTTFDPETKQITTTELVTPIYLVK